MSTASDNQRTLNRTGAVIAIGMPAAQAQDKLAPVPGAPVTPTIPVAPGEVKIIKGEEPTP